MKAKFMVFQMEGHASGLIVLPPGKYQPATCCDGRMVAFIVNREGTTRCVMCDAKELERQATERTQTPLQLPFVSPDDED